MLIRNPTRRRWDRFKFWFVRPDVRNNDIDIGSTADPENATLLH